MARDLPIPNSLTPEEGLLFLERADELGLEDDHIAADEVLLAVLRHFGHNELVDRYEAMTTNFYYI